MQTFATPLQNVADIPRLNTHSSSSSSHRIAQRSIPSVWRLASQLFHVVILSHVILIRSSCSQRKKTKQKKNVSCGCVGRTLFRHQY